jgi:hypothetical protein
MIRVLVRDGAISIGMGVENAAHQGVPAAANQRQRTNCNVQNDPFHGTIMVVSSDVGTAGRMILIRCRRRTGNQNGEHRLVLVVYVVLRATYRYGSLRNSYVRKLVKPDWLPYGTTAL